MQRPATQQVKQRRENHLQKCPTDSRSDLGWSSRSAATIWSRETKTPEQNDPTTKQTNVPKQQENLHATSGIAVKLLRFLKHQHAVGCERQLLEHGIVNIVHA
jgi:hypothetical protein